MSMHRSLKTKPSALNQHRNVLTRAERIGRLTEKGTFESTKNSPLGLPKVGNRLMVTKKPKKTEAEGAEGAAAAPGAAPAAGAAAKPGAGAAPAAKAADAKGGAKKK